MVFGHLKMILLRGMSLILILFLAMNGHAEIVTEDMVRIAALSFISEDEIGADVLKGTSLSSVDKRGNLWVVHLAPSGYAVFSGTDLAAPVVAFSRNDFIDPPEGTAFYAVMKGADDGCAALESETASGRSSRMQTLSVDDAGESFLFERRRSKWQELLSGQTKRGASLKKQSLQSVETSVRSVNVAPFLTTKWNQWRPYNDFMPVHNPENVNDVYRGRSPCGCTATAASQILAYWRWPVRIDEAFSCEHIYSDNLSDDKDKMLFGIRFDGSVPFDWDLVNDTYDSDGEDWSFAGAESLRYHAARAVLFCDSLSWMHFSKKNGSSATFYNIANNALSWYDSGKRMSVDGNSHDDLVAAVKADIQNGIPVQINIPGHAVIGHGWKEDSTSRYVYLNYGWGGGNDGYYNVDDVSSSSSIQEVCIGFAPRKSVTMAPLPVISKGTVHLSWCVPECYEADIDGFQLELHKESETTVDFHETFSDSFSPAFLGMGNSSVTNGKLRLHSLYSSAFAFRELFALTSRSMVSFTVNSAKALGMNVEIQASFDGGDWITLVKPSLNEHSGNEGDTYSYVISLGHKGGSLARFRIVNRTIGAYYVSGSYADIDDFCVYDVLRYDRVRTFDLDDGRMRSISVSNLQEGGKYSFSITPTMTGAVQSIPVFTRVEGKCRQMSAAEDVYERIDELEFNVDSVFWSANGNVNEDSKISPTNNWRSGFSCFFSAPMHKDAVLSFDWSANSFYDESKAYDVLTAVFEEYNGSSTVFWTVTNGASCAGASVSLSLSAFKGKTGIVKVRFLHEGSQYTSSGHGVTFYSPKISNVNVPILSELMWKDGSHSALQTPEILAVDGVKDGLFYQCSMGTTVFDVTCSTSTDRLEAIPSHYSLVAQSDVDVIKNGDGTFTVKVDASNIPDSMERSRMILTLKAINRNGTSSAKNLVLRFSKLEMQNVTVSFNANGGVVSPAAKFVTIGSAIGSLPTPTYDGYRFEGWYTSVVGGVKISTSTVVSGDVTYYAHWTKINVEPTPASMFRYIKNNGAVTISKYIGTAAYVGIPSSIEGLPVTGIGYSAFKGSSLSGVTVSGSVRYIDSFAFENCVNLKNVVMEYGLEDLGVFAFRGCSNLTSVTLPQSLKNLGGYVFADCVSLLQVAVPQYIVNIGSGSFSECSSLVSISIPDCVTNIGAYAFWKCSALKDVGIPDCLKSIADYAFYGCSSISDVMLPAGVYSIGTSAFSYCSSLAKVKAPSCLRDEIESKYVFWDCPRDMKIEYYGEDEGNGGDHRGPTSDWEFALYGDIAGYMPETMANVYDGYLYHDGKVIGTVQTKVAKPKNGRAKVTTTVQVVGEKKVSIKGEMDVVARRLNVMANDGRVLDVMFGADGMSGMLGIYKIDGARNLFSSKDSGEKAHAERLLAPWIGTLNMFLGSKTEIRASVGGVLSVTIAKKGKVTVKGTVSGEKVSAKAQAIIGERHICIPVAYSKKSVNLAFTLCLPIGGGAIEVVGIDATTGRPGVLRVGAKFHIAGGIMSNVFGAISAIDGYSLLSEGMSVEAAGSKWVVAGGAKPAKVSYKKGRLSVAPGKKGGEIANTSGLKLKYKAKDGSFTGSFTVYALEGAKLKKHKASVSGVLVNGIGYGTATIKKLGSWTVEIR